MMEFITKQSGLDGPLHKFRPNPVVQLVASQIADPGVMSSILALPHTFVEIDHEIFSTVILFLPLIQEGLLSVTSKSMCTEYWLTSC